MWSWKEGIPLSDITTLQHITKYLKEDRGLDKEDHFNEEAYIPHICGRKEAGEKLRQSLRTWLWAESSYQEPSLAIMEGVCMVSAYLSYEIQ